MKRDIISLWVFGLLFLFSACTQTPTDNSSGGDGGKDISISKDGSTIADADSGGCKHGEIQE